LTRGLIAELKELREGKRPEADTLTSQAVAGLSDADLAALVHFSASR
jgi:cytochrome c553